ncbi:MAG: ABC transporter permease [Actinomycetes bacterium]
MRAWQAQSAAEVKMTIKRGETLLLTIGIPLLLLIFFSFTSFVSLPGAKRVDFLAPGIIALCVMSTSLVSLSIATGFDRSYGVLRRLFTTPLGTRSLVVSKIVGVVVVELLQVLIVGGVAIAIGWRPHGGPVGAAICLLALLVASIAFAGIGLLLAGNLKAEVNLAAANGLYLVLLLVSGFVIPVTSFPSFMRHAVIFTPSGALAGGLHNVVGSGVAFGVTNIISLVVWAVIAPLLASRAFSYE